jgi:16S rRNA (cytidine1402-2'-O)-methyltransferase
MARHIDRTLYVVATPIGNLQDITLRALDVLKRVDLIVSENVRKTRNLLRHYGIKTKVVSYREENARRMIPLVVDLLKKRMSVALVAEAGTPGISDPGRRLVDSVRKEGWPVVPVPGPSALIAAVSISGSDDARFVFEGFLPRRAARRRQRLKELAGEYRQIIFFEAPHRLVSCLNDMKRILGNRPCLIAREMTKMHEEIRTGNLSEFIDLYSTGKPRGEFVIVCEGSRQAAKVPLAEIVVEEARPLLRRGMRKKEIAKIIAEKHNVRTGDVYRIITEISS